MITALASEQPHLGAFELSGTVTREDMDAMAKSVLKLFERTETANLLLVFRGFQGTEPGAGFDWDAIKAQFKSLTNVGRYAVVNPPESAAKMIEFFDHVIPVDARAFEADELHAAQHFVEERA